MASLDLTFNPKKAIRKADLVRMADMIKKAAADPKVKMMRITFTDDAKGTANSMTFPLLLVDEKPKKK